MVVKELSWFRLTASVPSVPVPTFCKRLPFKFTVELAELLPTVTTEPLLVPKFTAAPLTVTVPLVLPIVVLAVPVVLISVVPTMVVGAVMASMVLPMTKLLAPEVMVTLPVPLPPMLVLAFPVVLIEVAPVKLMVEPVKVNAVALCSTVPVLSAINPLTVDKEPVPV